MSLVKLVEERVMASSLDIAKHFHKRHSNLLRDIENLECSEDFKERNFIEVSYYVRGRAHPYYNLTPSGLFLLLSSFTGKDAIKAKEFIINQIEDLSFIVKALLNFEIPEDLSDLYLYLIKEKNTSNYKVGISKDPEARLKQLQTGNSSELELIYFAKAENKYKEERELHKLLEEYKLQGEWFYLENEIPTKLLPFAL